MIFTRIFTALFATAVCAQALYVPNVLYTWDLEHSRDVAARGLSERGLHHLDAIRELAERDNVLVLDVRDLSSLKIRSEDILSHLILARMENVPPEGPYQCKTKDDCKMHITHAEYRVKVGKESVDKWRKALKEAGNDKDKKRDAKNNLDTAQGNYDYWKERIEDYTKMMAGMKN